MGNESVLVRLVRTNWHLLLVLLAIVGVAVVFAMRPKKSADVQAAITGGEIAMEMSGGEDAVPYKEESRWAQKTKDARFEDGIKKYEHEVAYNRQSAETPGNMFKLANLYFAKGDWSNASKYYVSMMQEFPQYEGMRYVFQNLVTCYEQTGNQELRRNTLRQMMEHFPADTPEHKFAEQQLGL